MNTRILEIQPRELKFIFEVKKQSSCSVTLTNDNLCCVAFKVKTTSPKKYCVRPNVGTVPPKSSCQFTVTMQAQKAAPPDLMCKDKFLIQSTIVPVGTTDMDITPLTFTKDDGKFIEEVKLKVMLISPPQSPVLSPVNREIKEEPFSDHPVLKDQVLKKIENLMPSYMHKPAKEGEFKDMNGQRFFTTEKDLELKPKMDVNSVQDIQPTNDAGLKSNKDIVNNEELEEAKHESLKPDKDSVNVNQIKPLEEPESPAVKDEQFTMVKAIDEQKLVADIEEMNSKLNVLESKLIEAESTISKLKEERRLSTEDRKMLKEELALLRSGTSVRRVHVGFPLLFVVMVALVSLVLGYVSHP